MKPVLAAVVTLSCWAVAPVALSATAPVAADYAPDSQTLQLSLPAGVVPNARELAHPPRFVIDLPGVPPARTIERDYASGLANHLSVQRLGRGTRVVLGLRRPLSNAWRANLLGDRLQFTLAPIPLAQAPLRPPVPHPSSGLVPHPLPRLKPSKRRLPPRAPVAAIALATPTPKRPLTPAGPAAPHLPAPAPTSPTLPPLQAPNQLPSPGAAETPVPVATPTPAPAARPTPAPRPEPSPVATAPRPAASLPSATPATPVPTPGAGAAVVAAVPAATNPCRIGTVAYDERIRILSVPLAGPVAPQYTLTEAPARLTIDLPGSTIGVAQHLANPAGLVTGIAAYQSSPTSTRVVVELARPIGTNYLVKQTPGALIVIFDRKPVTP